MPPVAEAVAVPLLAPHVASVFAMLTVGFGRTVTTTWSVEVQPLASVTVTVYVVVAAGVTVVEAVLAPLLQLNVKGDVPPVRVAVSVALAPAQMAWSAPALAVGPPMLLMVTLRVPVQPFASVTVTV